MEPNISSNRLIVGWRAIGAHVGKTAHFLIQANATGRLIEPPIKLGNQVAYTLEAADRLRASFTPVNPVGPSDRNMLATNRRIFNEFELKTIERFVCPVIGRQIRNLKKEQVSDYLDMFHSIPHSKRKDIHAFKASVLLVYQMVRTLTRYEFQQFEGEDATIEELSKLILGDPDATNSEKSEGIVGHLKRAVTELQPPLKAKKKG